MPEPIGVIGIVCPDELRRCSASSRWCCRRSRWATRVVAVPSRALPAGRHRPLPGARHLGRARRRGQHRHRRRATSWPRCWPRTTTSTRIWYFGTARGRGDGRAALGRQHEADLGRRRPRRDWLDRAHGEGARVPARRRPRSRTSGSRTGNERDNRETTERQQRNNRACPMSVADEILWCATCSRCSISSRSR